jgi:hypothetical protein
MPRPRPLPSVLYTREYIQQQREYVAEMHEEIDYLYSQEEDYELNIYRIDFLSERISRETNWLNNYEEHGLYLEESDDDPIFVHIVDCSLGDLSATNPVNVEFVNEDSDEEDPDEDPTNY